MHMENGGSTKAIKYLRRNIIKVEISLPNLQSALNPQHNITNHNIILYFNVLST